MLEVVDQEDKQALEQERCSKCHISRAEDHDLSLFAGMCGHFLCKTCHGNEFDGRPIAECLVCGEEHQKNSYVPRRFESGEVHRTVMIRKEVLKELNLSLEDFGSDERKFNDYLEFKEDVVYNLEFNIDVARTKSRVELFKKRHRDQINKNTSRTKREQMERENLIKAENDRESLRLKEKVQQIQDAKRARERLRLDRLENLATSNDPKAALAAIFEEIKKEREDREKEEKEKEKNKSTISFDASQPTNSYRLFKYVPVKLSFHGPTPPSTPMIQQRRMVDMKPMDMDAARAGGFSDTLSLKHCLADACTCLFD
eukprot:m.67101 g.67101  ORF g.67101 m.67101 type:complete len:314 (+) comp8203_c1_seq2:381-1322(+)